MKPDLTIYIDIPPDVVLQRLKRKKSVMETIQNQRRVREIYLKLVKACGLRLVDGNKPRAEVAKEILSVVAGFISARDA